MYLNFFLRSPLKQLALHLEQEQFFPCLLNIFEYLVDQMNVHYQIVNWHNEFAKNSVAYIDPTEYTILTKSELEKREKEAKRASEDFADIKKGIESYKATIWDEMQRKIGFLLAAPSLLHTKIEAFLRVLDTVNKFVAIGCSFSSTDSFYLQGSIKKVSKAYFRNYHKTRVEDLYTMLENQLWQKVPLPSSNFNVMSIKEFKEFVDEMVNTFNDNNIKNMSGSYTLNINQEETNVFVNFAKEGNPFSRSKTIFAKKTNIETSVEMSELEKQLEQEEILEDMEEKNKNVRKSNFFIFYLYYFIFLFYFTLFYFILFYFFNLFYFIILSYFKIFYFSNS